MANGPGELPRELLHLATLAITSRSAPFTHARSLPLHTLSHLLQEYLALLASSAKDAAELAGRDQVSVWDLGTALDEFGTGTLAELKEEAQRGDEGIGEESQRLRELARNLRDVVHPRPPPLPVAQLCYDALHTSEIIAINELPDLVHTIDSSEGSDDSDDAGPLSPEVPVEDPVIIKHEESSTNLFLDSWNGDVDVDMPVAIKDQEMDDEDDAPSSSRWRDPSLIPSYVPSFLPPFPGMERDQDVSSPMRRRREREREREAAQAEAWAAGAQRVTSASMGGDPWAAPIPYASSMLADMHPISNLPALSPPPASPPPGSPSAEDDDVGERAHRRRARSISPPVATTSSLEAYRNTAPEIPHLATWLRPNPKRRLAASSISLSSDLSLSSSDSLFGLLPVPPTRQASRPPGFLPDYAPPRIHPFNTSLPHTISSPVPYNAAAGHLLAPPPHPRVPNALGRVKDTLAQPTSPHLALFTRLTRSGPPGPLGPKGEALEYEYVGTSAVVALNVEWPVRAHNARLPTTIREEEMLGGPSAAPTPQTGIKLKLGRGGSQSQAGSPAPTPGPSGWGGANGSGVFGSQNQDGVATGREGSVAMSGYHGSPTREMDVVPEENGGHPNGQQGYGEPMLGVSEAGEAYSNNVFDSAAPQEESEAGSSSLSKPFDDRGTTFTFKAQPSTTRAPSPPPAPTQSISFKAPSSAPSISFKAQPPPPPAPSQPSISFKIKPFGNSAPAPPPPPLLAPAHQVAPSFSYNPFEARLPSLSPPPPPAPAPAPDVDAQVKGAAVAPSDDDASLDPAFSSDVDPNLDPSLDPSLEHSLPSSSIAPDSYFDAPSSERAAVPQNPPSLPTYQVNGLAPPASSSGLPSSDHSPAPSPIPAHVLEDPIAAQVSQMFSPEALLTPQGSPEPSDGLGRGPAGAAPNGISQPSQYGGGEIR